MEAIPLRLELFAALGEGDGVLEFGVVGPELEFGEAGAAGEEVEDGAYEGFLVGGEVDARGGVDVFVFDLEFGGGGHSCGVEFEGCGLECCSGCMLEGP